MANPKKKISIPNSFEYNYISKEISKYFDVITCDEETCAKNLFYENTEIAIISPVEYAKSAHIRNYMIFPEIGVSYYSDFDDLILVFNPGAGNIQKIAHRPGQVSSKFLTDILFRENYDIEPSFSADPDKVQEVLKKYNALILSGNEAREINTGYESKLYLAQEWAELTELPFVAGIWVSREDVLEPEEVKLIIDLQKEYLKNLPRENYKYEYNSDNVPYEEDKNEYFDENDEESEDNHDHEHCEHDHENCEHDHVHIHEHENVLDNLYSDELYPGLNLKLGEDEEESLKAQFEYSFFHGFAEEIPDLKFYEI
jgi:predicted solute-binding protein